MTPHQFRQGLRRCFRLPITEPQMAALVDKYSLNGVVKYVEFESNLSALVDAMNAGGEMAVPGGGLGSLRPEEATALDELLEELRTEVANRRLLLTPTFQDFDRRRTSHVTADQFKRVLSMTGLFKSDAALAVLLKAYAATEGRHPPQGFVNWRRFVADVDPNASQSALPALPGAQSGKPALAASRSASSVLSAVAEGKPALSASLSASSPALAQCTRDVPTLLAAVRAYVHQRRVRLKEVFRDDDKLRKGLVTRAQFYRGLATAVRGFDFTPSEIGALADEYAEPLVLDPQGAPWVKWVVFVGDVDRVFTLDDLEKRPTLDVEVEVASAHAGPHGGACGASLGGAAPRSIDEASDVHVTALVARLAEEVRVKGLELAPFYEDFDRANRGCVTVPVFKRVLSMVGLLPLLTADNVELLVAKFLETAVVSIYDSHHHPDVNYKAFIAALELATQAPGLAGSGSVPNTATFRHSVASRVAPAHDDGSSLGGATRMLGPESSASFGATLEGPLHSTRGTAMGGRDGAPPPDAATVVDDIVAQMRARRIRLHDFLTDGDKLRSGEISGARFRSAIGRAVLTLTTTDLDVLHAAFASRRHADLVDWRAFAGAMASGLAALDGCEAPASTTASTTPEHVDGAQFDALLAKIRTEVAHRRLHMKPYFQDYDPHNGCYVTRTQMCAVLDKMKLPLSQADVELLCQAFEVPAGLHPVGQVFINYKSFVKRVDGAETC